MITKLLELLLNIARLAAGLLSDLASASLKVQKALFKMWADRVRRKYNIKDD